MGTRSQVTVSAAGILTVADVTTHDVGSVSAAGILSVGTRAAPDVDVTSVSAGGILTSAAGGGETPYVWAPRTDAVVDLDFETSNFYVNGVQYGSIAEMVTAGVYFQPGGDDADYMPSTAWLTAGAGMIVRFQADATTSAALGAANMHLLNFVDDGVNPSVDGITAYRNFTDGTLSLRMKRNSAEQLSSAIDKSNPGATKRIGWDGQFKLNATKNVTGGGAVSTDTGCTMSLGIDRMIIGGYIIGTQRPWSGTIHRLTIYTTEATDAQLQLESLDIGGRYPDVGYDRSVHTTVVANGKTVVGLIHGSTTDQRVLAIDNDERRVTSRFDTLYSGYSKDDHNHAVLEVLPDGRLIVGYTGHNQDDTVRFRISTDGDPANFGSEITVTTGVLGETTYIQFVLYGTDVYILTRGANATVWDIFLGTAADDYATWARRKQLIEISGMPVVDQLYVKARASEESVAYLFVNPHISNTGEQPVKLMEWDKATGALTADGVALGNINAGSNSVPITTYAALPAFYTPTSGRSATVVDMTGDGTEVLLEHFVTADLSDMKYLYGRLAGADRYDPADWTWETVLASPGAIVGNQAPHMCFANETHTGLRLYVAREAAGTSYLDRMDSADNGANWTVTNIASHATDRIFRPQSPKNASAEIPVLWIQGSWTDFTTWTTDLRWQPPE